MLKNEFEMNPILVENLFHCSAHIVKIIFAFLNNIQCVNKFQISDK